jgi:Zn-dependent peptidase ImmA (M78 family)
MRLRAELGVSDYDYLPLETAVTCIPNCEFLSLRHVPSIPFEVLIYFRTDGYHIGAFALPDERGVKIVYNDAHPPNAVRVNVMEELFHLRLGHKPDILSVVSRNGRHRTYDVGKEDEALGCAVATLVPFAGLHAMLSRQMHIRRIAEHFAVPVEVVERRIGSTNLGDLMNAQLHRFALMPEDLANPLALSTVNTRITEC